MEAQHEHVAKGSLFFCSDPLKDPVAHRVWDASQQLFKLDRTGIEVDGQAVLAFEDDSSNKFYYVPLDDVLSHDYSRYLPILNEKFSDFDFAGVVNWHEGKNAPDAILTVHTTGDVLTGDFGLADPVLTRTLVLAIDEHRKAAGLEGFTTTTEATHWSGVVYGGSPALITRYNVPIVDIEIGSSLASWSNTDAVNVIARSLPLVFNSSELDLAARSLLCVGGVHLETAFAQAILTTRDEYPLAVSHVLPNHWIVDGGYDAEEGMKKLEDCINSIIGGVHAIVFHDNLKSAYKTQVRLLGERLGIPYFKHKALRQPQSLPIW
jgi:D-tyrosyl-tRNA(Tyr) deacylase